MKNELIDAIVERRAKVPDVPWFVAGDDAKECGPHKDSGLALVDTGRESDWPIARLCYWPVAEFIANAPTDIDTLLEALRESEADVKNMREQFNALEDDWQESEKEADELRTQLAAAQAEVERLKGEHIKLVLEIAGLRVKPIVDKEKEGEVWP